MNSEEFCIVITTTNERENADYITSCLISNKLAVCAQLDEILSFFYWEGKLCELKEFRLMVKALSANYYSIEKAIKKCHSYTLPEIIKLDISSGLPQYLDWLKKNSCI